MTVRRAWPKPLDGPIVNLIGDTHFGSVHTSGDNKRRQQVWARDLANVTDMLPESVVHLVVGDLVDGLDVSGVEDTEAVTFMDTVFGPGHWVSAVGNHDFYGRTADEAAIAWGLPAANSVHDYGSFRIIRLAPDVVEGDGYTMQPFPSSRLNWLNSQLQAAGDVPCLMVCHWSLYDTVMAGEATPASTEPGWYAYDDADIRTVLADNNNAAAWLSGHTHTDVDVEGIVTGVPMGGHTLCAINASAVAYVGAWDGRSPLNTMYLTVTDGQIDVRFRNHGAGIWTSATPQRLAKVNVPITSFTPATGYGTSPYGTSPYGG